MHILQTARLFAALAAALPATACGAPAGCTTDSYNLQAWTVKDFDFHASYVFSTPAHQNSWGYVNFVLENPALDYSPTCSAMSDQLQDFFYGTVSYACTGVPAGSSATFTFDRPANKLHLNQTWHCADDNDAVFNAVGGATFDLVCNETKWQNPDWKMGEMFSTDDITCDPVTVSVPVEEVEMTG